MLYTKIIALSLSLLALSAHVQASAPAPAKGQPGIVHRFMNNATAGGKTTGALAVAAASGAFWFVHRTNLFGLRTHGTIPLINYASKYWENLKKGDTKTVVGTIAAAMVAYYWLSPKAPQIRAGGASSVPLDVDASEAERLVAEELVRVKLIAAAKKLQTEGSPMEFKKRVEQAREALKKARDAFDGKPVAEYDPAVIALRQNLEAAALAFDAAQKPPRVAAFKEHSELMQGYIDALEAKSAANPEAIKRAIEAEARRIAAKK